MFFGVLWAGIAILMSDDFPSEVNTEMQILCMCITLRYGVLDNEVQRRNLIPPGIQMRDVCHWTGVRCTSKAVTEIRWEEQHQVVHFFHWLPSTLQCATMKTQNTRMALETRKLPRDIETLHFSSCEIIGSVDMKSLPRKIQEFRVEFNGISGNVYLTHLPFCLRVIDMRFNNLEEVLVDNENLPEGLKDVLFCNIGAKLRFSCTTGKKCDQRIRVGNNRQYWKR